MLTAQILAGYSISQVVMIAIVVAAVVAIGVVVIRQMGVPIPGWVAQIFWIVVIAVVGLFAIKLLLSLV